MLIANPLYDTVFKYLMEDLDIARELLSLILNTEIISLSVKPQEITMEYTTSDKTTINIYRLDFVAVFKQPNGKTKKALIELQKSKRTTDIMRFRRYLGENYQREDVVTENGLEVPKPLEIITIYLLGFILDDVPVAIMQVKNKFVNAVTGEALLYEPRDQFVRLLNHESYTIQIPLLTPNTKNKVELTLDIFNQRYKTADRHILDYGGTQETPLLNKIVHRLTRAIADEQMRKKMDIEDDLDSKFQDLDSQIQKYRQELQSQKQELQSQKQELQSQKQELQDKDKEIAALKKLLSKK
jgi:hypothetical protein